MRKIGFCHGVAHKFLDPYSEKNISLLKSCGSNAIEVNCHSAGEVDRLAGIAPLVSDFAYRSIHLPCDLEYKDNQATNKVLGKIERFYRRIEASLAVVHPDLVKDWTVFDKYPTINWTIENMDDRKTSYRGYRDLDNFFAQHSNWGLVLDLGHCKANDQTMRLADDLITGLKDRVQEIHLSGYQTLHDPLYQTGQTDIISYCDQLEVPIIIESIFTEKDGPGALSQEFDYALKNLA